jgi:hypothetical protein
LKPSIPDYHLGKKKSEVYIIKLLKKLGIKITSRHQLTHPFEIKAAAENILINTPHEISFSRRNGRADKLQQLCDSEDRSLNTPISIGIMSDVPGLKINISANYESHQSTASFPALIEAPETSFSDEISFYRREAVSKFNSGDLVSFFSCYRAFLQSCVSLVECFIHRYTFHVKSLIPNTSMDENANMLDSRKSIEDRLEAWVQTFAYHRLQYFKISKNRSKFVELKNQRNWIVYPAYPTRL